MTGSTPPEHRIPVIVGVGEMVDRPAEIAAGLEPLALLEAALRRAEQDSGAKLLGAVNSPISSIFLVGAIKTRQDNFQTVSASRPGTPITARSAAKARSVICTKRRNGLRAGNAPSPRSAAPKHSRPRPRPSVPA